jgi:hypothetical protein
MNGIFLLIKKCASCTLLVHSLSTFYDRSVVFLIQVALTIMTPDFVTGKNKSMAYLNVDGYGLRSASSFTLTT